MLLGWRPSLLGWKLLGSSLNLLRLSACEFVSLLATAVKLGKEARGLLRAAYCSLSCQDAKTTIANTQFAKDVDLDPANNSLLGWRPSLVGANVLGWFCSQAFRPRSLVLPLLSSQERGIDVAKLDQWEQHIQEQANPVKCRNKKLLGTSASLLVTSALLVVTRSY